MAHHTLKSGYSSLVERLNRFPQGAPPSQTLYRILSILFSEKEAERVAQLPIKPFTLDKASQVWRLSRHESQKILDDLAGRAILVDMEVNGQQFYVLPPPMAGFFEFSLMRTRGDIDQKALSELFYQYMNIEEDFIRDLFTEGETQLGRTFIHEPILTSDNALHVFSYERASEVIKTASHIAIGTCYCRHKMLHIDKSCAAPLDICMTFNTAAASLIKHGHARKVEVNECLDLLGQAYEHNLVQFGENVRKEVNFICNCCGCCCEAMIAARRFAIMNPVHTTNFIPEINQENCTDCGKCIDICPVEALAMTSANDPHQPKRRQLTLIEQRCLGCGLCVRNCPAQEIEMTPRKERVLTPLNGIHKVLVMALERDKLQDLIFDNRALFSHRAMAAVLGGILRLPPVKKTLAIKQVKSRYLEAIARKLPY